MAVTDKQHTLGAVVVLVETVSNFLLENAQFLSYTHLKFQFFFSVEDSPCIGLCFHNKQQAEEEGNVGEDADYSRGWPLNSNDFGPPCVGLCHLLREMNVENPETLLEEYRYQHTGVVANENENSNDGNDYSDGHDSSKK